MSELAYQEDRRYEWHGGKPVCMSPSPIVSHSLVVGNIYRIFSGYLRNKPCIVFSDNADLHLSEKDVFIPDVMIVCRRDIIKRRGIFGAPDLVVEVLSPRTAKYDRGYKKDTYAKHGVKEYWIVDVESRLLEVYLLKENKLDLDNIYYYYFDYELPDLLEEERELIVPEFKTSLYDDLTIVLAEVFENKMLNWK